MGRQDAHQTIFDYVNNLARSGGNGTPGASPARTVNINLGGRTTAVNVASDSDADALASVLQQLERAASVSL